MASEWLKIEVNTPEKQEVLAITVALGWDDPDFVFSKLFRVWCWFDQHTVEGIAPQLSRDLIDRISGVPGMAKAMRSVGWLLKKGRALVLPNFERHNGKTAKERALTARRVGNFKAKHGADEPEISGNNGEGVDLPLPIKEKKIKENINSKTTTKTMTAPAAIDTSTVLETEQATAASDDVFPPGIDVQIINDFKALRKKLHLPITRTALDGLQREGAKAGMSLEAVLKMCCERGWRGFKADWAQDESVINGRSGKQKFDPVEYVNRNRTDMI